MFKALLLSSLALNLGLLLGRLSGFVREALIATTYGATAEADIVVLMLTVPDLLVNILAGGALGAALVPEFTQRPEQSRQLLYQSLIFFGVAFFGAAAGFYWQTDLLVTLLAPGFAAVQAEHSAVALGWVIWLIPLTVLAGVVTAYLHAQNRFAIAALGTLIINTSIIVGLYLIYAGYGSLYIVALFVIIGGILRLFSQLLSTRPTWAPLTSLSPSLLNRALLIRYGQAMLSGSVLLLFPVVARALASYQGEGSVALFNYAMRLVEFPLAIAVTFLAAIFFPRLSKSFTSDLSQHRMLIRYGVQITLGLALIAAITLISQSDAYTQIVYGYGGMEESSLKRVEVLTSIGLFILPFQGLSIFLTATFNARKDTRTPLVLNGAGLVFFLLVSNTGIFGQGLEGLMWGMVVSYGLVCILQLMFLKIEAFRWQHVFLDSAFLSGMGCGVVFIILASHLVNNAHLPILLALVLAGLSALISLCIMALFNRDIRSGVLARLGTK